MHAIRHYAFGPPENLRYEEVDDLAPGPGEVRIAVGAAGVHFADVMLRAGLEGGLPLPELPMTPGREVAGTVDQVGEGVDGSWLGRRVAAYLGHEKSGGYAEFAVEAVTADLLFEIPDGVDDAEAVALIGTGRTTVGILETAALTPSDVVLVAAAAGGIGALLVQAAREVGAEVVGLAGGPEKVAAVRELGATAAVDYSVDGWPEKVGAALGGRPATVVFEGVGGELGRAAVRLLGPGGRHIYYGWISEFHNYAVLSDEERAERGITSEFGSGALFARPDGMQTGAREALAMAGAGRWRPLVQRFALADAAAAHTALMSRTTMGKVVLVP